MSWLDIYHEIFLLLFAQNTDVMNNLYDVNWYQKSTKFRQEMMMFMIRLQKPQHIKIFKAKVLNWALVASIIQFTYSLLQVFRRVQIEKHWLNIFAVIHIYCICWYIRVNTKYTAELALSNNRVYITVMSHQVYSN